MRDNPVALVYGYTPYEEATYDTYRGLRAWVLGGTSTYDKSSDSESDDDASTADSSEASRESSGTYSSEDWSSSGEGDAETRGLAALEGGDFQAATRWLSEALETGRTAARFIARARAHLGLNEIEAALADAKKAQALAPMDHNIALTSAEIAFRLDKSDIALAFLATHSTAQATDLSGHINSFTELLKEARAAPPDRALVLCENALRLNDQSVEVQLLLAKTLLRLDRPSALLQLSEEILQRSRNIWQGDYLACKALIALGRLDEAAQRASTLTGAKSRALRLTLAQLQSFRRESQELLDADPNAAAAVLTEALQWPKLSPALRAEFALRRALARRRLGLLEEALSDLGEAIGLKESPEALSERSELLLFLGRPAEALADLVELMKLRPSVELGEQINQVNRDLILGQRKNYYSLLGVAPTACSADIKKAYHRLALRWHPDKQRAGTDSDLAEQMMKEITEAYQTLSDGGQRRAYDTEASEMSDLAYLAELFTQMQRTDRSPPD